MVDKEAKKKVIAKTILLKNADSLKNAESSSHSANSSSSSSSASANSKPHPHESIFKKRDFLIVGLAFVILGVFVGFLIALGLTPTGNVIGVNSCFDADGGKNIRAYGYTLAGNERLFDYCDSEQVLVEYYCGYSGSEKFMHRCARGCESGRCL